MSETWFRGESTVVGPAKPGSNLHDFGEGICFTSSADVARAYADLRVKEGGGEPRVLSLTVERSQLGQVLNLDELPEWQAFIRTPMSPNGMTPEQLIRTAANENYSRLFDGFIRENKIDLRRYDAVQGPELVRGGTQLCITHIANQQSPLARQLKQLLVVQPDARFVTKFIPIIPTIDGRGVLVPNSLGRRVLGNQAAVALLGQLVASAIQRAGDAGIAQQINSDISTRLAPDVAAAQARGKGVL